MGAAQRVEPPLDIERFGALQADLAAGVSREDVLASARLTDAQLAAATDHWLEAMGKEVRRGRSALSQRYARAYVARRPELLCDPEEASQERVFQADKTQQPIAIAAPEAEEGPEASVAAPHLVPSFMLEAQPPAAPTAPPAVRYAVAAPDATLPPIAVPFRSDVPFKSGDAAPPPPAPTPASEPPPAPAPAPAPALAGTPKKRVFATMMAMDIPAGFKAMPFAAAAPGAPPSEPPAAPTAPATSPASRSPASTAASTPAPAASKPLSVTAMGLDVPQSFKAVPFSSDPPSLSPRAPSPPSRTAPPSSAPPASLPFSSALKHTEGSPLSGTAMAFEVPASFKAVPFSSDRPASPRVPSPTGTPPPPTRPALTGTAMSFDIQEHLKKIPLSGTPPPPAPAPPAPAPPAPRASNAPPKHLQTTAPLPHRPPSHGAIPVVRPLPLLEHYVRMGVDLATTPADQVEAALARANWTRGDWAHIDQAYRDRIAKEPAVRQAFQTALNQERARRAGRTR